MSEFDVILEECVDLIASGESSLEECLIAYPEYSTQLEPILCTATRLREARDVTPPPFLRARIRGELRQAAKVDLPEKSRFPVFFWQKALNVYLMILTVIMTNTFFAQGALPGEILYKWKLASENLWRAITSDPVGTDLELSNRRVREYLAVSADQQRRTQVLVGYDMLLARFEAEHNQADRARITSVLQSEQDSLHRVGLSIPALDKYFAGRTDTNIAIQPSSSSVP